MASKTYHGFAESIQAYAAKTQRTLDKTVRAFAIGMFSEVIRRTPVDTGRLRGNWQTSAGMPNYSVTDREDKGGAAAIAEVTQNVRSGVVNYLTNNLPYAARREQEGGAPVKGATRTTFGVGKGGNFIEKIMDRRFEVLRKAVADATSS